MSFARWTVMVTLLGGALGVVASSGCVASHGDAGTVRAINLHTGETRDFAEASAVPDGWVVCADDGCPAPVACTELDETSCLARIDCEAVYAEALPPECDVPPGSGRPVPAYCGTLPFVGCSVGGGGGGCGAFPACLLACPPGTHNPVDADGCVHTCECVPDDDVCGEGECGPALGAPAILCEDGSIGGNTGRCLRNPDGACGWEIRECPPPPPPPAECAVEECGPPLGMPSRMCDDGSYGGPTGRCLRNPDGVCGWEVRSCPPSGGACPADACPAYRHLDPVCADGVTSSATCERALDGTCGWHFSCGECTDTDCGPAPGADPMCPASGGTPGTSATLSCERNLDGTCGWHFACG